MYSLRVKKAFNALG